LPDFSVEPMPQSITIAQTPNHVMKTGFRTPPLMFIGTLQIGVSLANAKTI
jgi:hypothetical protein